jgi:hypothetical protein
VQGITRLLADGSLTADGTSDADVEYDRFSRFQCAIRALIAP